jgi:hypothetical protein
MSAKTVKELNKIIDSAPEKKVREVLKQIAHEWWVVGKKLDFDKELNSDTLEAVTTILHTNGFCPVYKGSN